MPTPHSIEELIATGVLQIAKQPPDNPTTLDFERLMLTPIDHDYPGRTPAMWNAVYRQFNLPVGSVMVIGEPVTQAGEIFEAFRRDQRYSHGGVGAGFKDEAPRYLDQLEPLAEAIGATNFIVKTSAGQLRGYNTDGIGYRAGFEAILQERRQTISDQAVLIIGAGGTAAAIAFALAQAGAHLTILNRTVAKAEHLAESVNQFLERTAASAGGLDLIPATATTVDLVVSTVDNERSSLDSYSMLGVMEPTVTAESIQRNRETAAAALKQARSSLIVSDVRLRREPTAMLQQAAALGFQTLDGTAMVINQATAAFWIRHRQELEANGLTEAVAKDRIRVIMAVAIETI